MSYRFLSLRRFLNRRLALYVSALIRCDQTSRGLRFMQSQTAEAGIRAVTRTDFGDQIVKWLTHLSSPSFLAQGITDYSLRPNPSNGRTKRG